jgi:hypothetical protein
VILGHGRWRRRTALLAFGALDEAETVRARAHVATCPSCAHELDDARAALDLVSADPVGVAEPPIPLGALVARVQARLDERPAPAAIWRPLLAGTGLLAAAVLAAVAVRSWRPPVPPVAVSPEVASTGRPPSDAGPAADSAEAVRRIESTLERERAARYLSDAQDVLVTVASAPQRCVRRRNAVEVGPEAERSRELLARRRLFVEDTPSTVVARDVLDDVEEMLREVAALDPCARPQDLEAIRGEIARRHLLMKIDLVTRELQG